MCPWRQGKWLSRATATEAAEQVQLRAVAWARRINGQHRGNRQKVALVAALASRAELFAARRADGGLESADGGHFRECVNDKAREDRTILLSSYLLAEAEALADRVTIIRHGKTVETGTLAEMWQLTRSSAEAETRAPVALEGLPGVRAERHRNHGALPRQGMQFPRLSSREGRTCGGGQGRQGWPVIGGNAGWRSGPGRPDLALLPNDRKPASLRHPWVPSARPAPCSPGAAWPPGGPLPADPVDAPGHATSAPTGRGVREVLVRAAPPPAGAGVVDLCLVPPPLVPHGELQGWPCGHGCGQAVGAPGQAGQAPRQAEDVPLGGSRFHRRSSPPRTLPAPGGAYPRASAQVSALVQPDIRCHVRIVSLGVQWPARWFAVSAPVVPARQGWLRPQR